MTKNNKTPELKKHIYYVRGMRCASCEVLIEKRLLKEKGIEAVEASVSKNEVRIEYIEKRPTLAKLNKIFRKEKYIFYDKPFKTDVPSPLFQFNQQKQLIVDKKRFYDFLTIFGISLLIIIGFIVLNQSGFAALLSVNSQSALPAFLVFGLLAGFSTCSALIGGILLSMSKQWLELYGKSSNWQRFQPHLLFNSGRLISYGLLGFLLGILGNALQISPTLTSGLAIGVSVLMVFLGLQMLGIKAFQKYQFTMPKIITRYVTDEQNFRGRWMPFLMGALTFFLPCGFTITAQGLALTSGNPLQAGLIMSFFALGTLPALLLIGITSVKFIERPHFSNQFLKIAGILVLFFAVYNFNSQLNVLGLKSLSDLSFNFTDRMTSKDGLPPIVNGKQVLKMDALAFGYEPNKLKVKAGVPVRWEVIDKGTSGCTNAIVSRGLFNGQIDLTPGEVSIKEFTPERPGKYKFSCWMGMVSGLIEVVDEKGLTGSFNDNAPVIDSGVQGCGCRGGCGGNCGTPNCPYAR